MDTHRIYTGVTAKRHVLLKCACGFEVEKPTEAEAREAHDTATAAVPAA